MNSDFDVDYDEELPDVSGLAPVHTLARLREGPAGPREIREALKPREALQRYWGYDDFRPLQAEAVAAGLAKKDVLIVLPTGGGKSLCYQVPAACGAGLVLVVSPLIALMDDQVAAARVAGLRAGALHTNATEEEKRRVRTALDADRLDLLYVSPERLSVGDLLSRLANRIALLAVDEAHCVSHWGHDFRPEYRMLGQWFAAHPNIPRMALTATATPQVQEDICAQLALRQPLRLVGHIDRPNLVYRCLQRFDQMKQILEVVQRHPNEGGIVYAQTRRDVERIAEHLAKRGVNAAGYHAGMDPQRRSRIQSDFVNERITVVAATIAFGMGIDRSNVRYVVHANAPKSIEHYQQEAGRAGRDGDPAECVLLFSAGDLTNHRSLAQKDGNLPPERLRVLNRHLSEVGRFALAPVCRHRMLTEHFGQPYPDPQSAPSASSGAASGLSESTSCGACDVCLGETKEIPQAEALLTAQKIISAVWRLGGRFGFGYAAAVLRGEPADSKQAERVTRSGHDQLSVYGLLKTISEPTVRAWIDQLVVQGHLAIVEEGDYALLTLTDMGKALCKGEGAVRLGEPQQAFKSPKKSRSSSSSSGASAANAPAMEGADKVVFDRLRTLRRLLAERNEVAPYMIFHDATLHQMMATKPTDLASLRTIKGVGDSKLAHYGEAFLKVLAGMDPNVAAE